MADDFPQLLRLAYRRAAAASAAALRPFGLDDRHLGVLRALDRLGPSSQRRLIDALAVDKSAMVRTVDDLERLGLVWRAPAAGDRRAYAVELTPAGRDLLADADRAATRAGTDLLRCLRPDEQAVLRDLLRRFVAAGAPVIPRPADGEPDDVRDGPGGPDPVPGYAPPHRTRRARAATLLAEPEEDDASGGAARRRTR